MLYPLKFKPIYKEKIWGGNKIKTVLGKDFGKLPNCGESWEISAVKGDLSKVASGPLKGNSLQDLIEIYFGDLVGEKVYQKFGVEFPLLFKFIDANDVLSVQVHPGDELAMKRHNAYGKTEMWYIIYAIPNAQTVLGFRKKVTKEEYLVHLENNTLHEILSFQPVFTGDAIFIPAGRVHATGEGILLAEIQQTSDITYRIYDWDRVDDKGKPRAQHTDLALEAIDYDFHNDFKINVNPVLNRSTRMVECDYFNTNIIVFNQPLPRDYNYIDSFVVYMCLEGSCFINTGKEKFDLKMGETILVPAIIKELTLEPVNSAVKLLEVYIR